MKYLVFLDESGARTDMKRTHGRSAKGQRLVDIVPGGHWRTTTMIAALRTTGVATAIVTAGPTDTLVFPGFVLQFLVPELQQSNIVVMDKLSCHKVKGVLEAIEAAGAQAWYLPPYSPDLNPVEQMWSKGKGVLLSFVRRSIPILYRVNWNRSQTCDTVGMH